MLSKLSPISLNGHYFYANLLNSNSIVIDLGAHLGDFSHQISKILGCKCYAVEALPTLYQKIEESNLVKKFNYAIAKSNQPVALYISKNPEANSINHSLAENWGTEGSIVVNGITFEEFLEANKINSIDLLKIDIEGAEIDLFNSTSDDTLGNIKQITIEFHDFIQGLNYNEEIKKIKERLRLIGFFYVVVSRPYNSNLDVLFINKNKCSLSRLEWLHIYALEYISLRLEKIKNNLKWFLKSMLKKPSSEN